MISTYHWIQVINILNLHWNNYTFSLSCQRNQAGNSPAMEFLGFQSCMDFLLGCGVVISTFISDRHTQIASHMKTVLKNITHYFDLWHLKKSKRSIAVIRFYYNFSMEFFFPILHFLTFACKSRAKFERNIHMPWIKGKNFNNVRKLPVKMQCWFKYIIYIVSQTDSLTGYIVLVPVVQKVNSAILLINLYPVDSAVAFPNTYYPLDSNLSSG